MPDADHDQPPVPVVSGQAGAVITPSGVTPAPPAPAAIAPAVPVPLPQAVAAPEAKPEVPQPPDTVDDMMSPSLETPGSPEQEADDPETVSWTASEFVAHQKSIGWYGLLALATAILAGAVYLATGDRISTLVVIVGAIALGGYGARQPRQLEYKADSNGITIGQKYFDYDSFRSFAITTDGAFSSIIFLPLKRFSPLTTIYYSPEDEDRIIDILEPRLPFEEYQHDAVDRLMRRIRF